MGRIKFDNVDMYNKSVDTVDTVPGLKNALMEFVESIPLPFEDDYNREPEELEYQSRDGFGAHSHNRGGIDRLAVSNIRYLVGGGTHYGLKIEEHVQESYDETADLVEKENPKLEGDELYQAVDEAFDSEYDAVAYRIRVMYEGQGVVRVYAGYDLDAPYFRWNNAADFEAEIKFNTISGLKRQLKALITKIVKAQ